MTAIKTLPAHSLEVVGVKYPNADGSNRRELIALRSPGDPVELRPEPTNQRDPYAVAVFDGEGQQLGYVRAERAPHIGKLIRQSMELRAIFQAATEHGAWIRVAFDGAEPVLPTVPYKSCFEKDDRFDPEWEEPA